VLKRNKHLAHMCGGVKTLKHNVWTTWWLAYHGCKNLIHTSKHVKQNAPNWLQLVGSCFARLLLFQTAKNRTQVATRRSPESMWDLNQNRRQKVFTIGGFTFAQRVLTFWKFDKIFTDYSVSYLNLQGLSEPTNAPHGDGSVLNFPHAVIIEKRTKWHNHRTK